MEATARDGIRTVVNLGDLPLSQSKTGANFEVRTGEIGMALGLKGLGAMLHVVPPGKSAFPFHRHYVSDEMFLILSGTGLYRTDEGILEVTTGDCLGAPAGGTAHQIINNGETDLRYVGFSNNMNADVVEHTDTGRISVNAGPTGYHYTDANYRAAGKLTPMKYWDGEDIGENE